MPMSRAPSISVGELLALVIIVGFLAASIYVMLRAKDRLISPEEIEIYKQYCWVVVSVVGGLALNGAMGRFTSSSYSSYGYQPYTPNIPQPGTHQHPNMQDPWGSMGGGVGAMKTMDEELAEKIESVESLVATMSKVANVTESNEGQDDNPNQPIDKHG